MAGEMRTAQNLKFKHDANQQAIPFQFRDAKYNANGTIDCVWNHPLFGEIPFCANPEDPEEHGRQIFAYLQAIAEPYTPDTPE